MTKKEPIDLPELLVALDNINNEGSLDFDTRSINRIKNYVLNQLDIQKDKVKEYQSKLKHYKYIDELQDLRRGRYIRWIKKNNHEHLVNGGILCDTKIAEDGTNLICKNFYNKVFEIKFKDNYIFQKITNQEKVLINVINYLNT